MIPRLRSGFRQRPQTPAQHLNFNVWTARKRVGKLRYMHRDPVKRGLVTEPDQRAWSCFRAYLYGEAGPYE
jgi:putative transposase